MSPAATLAVPLNHGADGVIRIGSTRVTLDTVVDAYRAGYEADEIVRQYSTLKLADVYSVLSYMLRHHDEVNEYLQRRQIIKDEVQRMNEQRCPPDGFRARLLARRQNNELLLPN